MRYYTGDVYTRNPYDGTNKLFGKLCNPVENILFEGKYTEEDFEELLKDVFPEKYEEFYGIFKDIEKHFKEMQHIEFAINNDEIFILSTEFGKRTASAARNIACDLVEEQIKQAPIEVIPTKNKPKIIHKKRK